MNCESCNSTRLLEVMAHCSDRCVMSFNGVEYDGYVPYDLNLGGGDDVEFTVCLDCGKIQGLSKWPDPQFATQ